LIPAFAGGLQDDRPHLGVVDEPAEVAVERLGGVAGVDVGGGADVADDRAALRVADGHRVSAGDGGRGRLRLGEVALVGAGLVDGPRGPVGAPVADLVGGPGVERGV